MIGIGRDLGEEESSVHVGFATYDQSIHFYNLKVIGSFTIPYGPLTDSPWLSRRRWSSRR